MPLSNFTTRRILPKVITFTAGKILDRADMAVFTIEVFFGGRSSGDFVTNVGTVGLDDFPLGSGNLKTLGLVVIAVFCCLEIVDPRSVVIFKVL